MIFVNDLVKKHCVPCENGEGKLHINTIKDYMPLVAGWFLIGDQIKKDFQFKNFKEAMEFVNKVADIAEEEGHRPNRRTEENSTPFLQECLSSWFP